MSKEFKERIIAAIVRDRLRAISLFTGFISSFIITSLAKYANIELVEERQIEITSIIGLILGWWIDGWASNKNMEGGAKVQENLQRAKPDLVVDGVMLSETIKASKEVAKEAISNG